jgi:hypothetical protein
MVKAKHVAVEYRKETICFLLWELNICSSVWFFLRACVRVETLGVA